MRAGFPQQYRRRFRFQTPCIAGYLGCLGFLVFPPLPFFSVHTSPKSNLPLPPLSATQAPGGGESHRAGYTSHNLPPPPFHYHHLPTCIRKKGVSFKPKEDSRIFSFLGLSKTKTQPAFLSLPPFSAPLTQPQVQLTAPPGQGNTALGGVFCGGGEEEAELDIQGREEKEYLIASPPFII